MATMIAELACAISLKGRAERRIFAVGGGSDRSVACVQIIHLWRVGLAGVYVVPAEHSLRDDGTGESQTLAWQDWLWQAGCCLPCPMPAVIIFMITNLL